MGGKKRLWYEGRERKERKRRVKLSGNVLFPLLWDCFLANWINVD